MTARPAVPAAAAADRVLFGPVELDLQRGRLLRAGVPVDVPPRPFALLCQLARQQGRVVPKDELLDAVWGQDFLGGSALKATVNNLRRALGEDGRSPRWVVSVARRGYCLQARPDAPPQALADAAGAQATAGADRGLIGREAELAQLPQLLAESRLVSVLGSAGIGKTRLVTALLPSLRGRFDDGVALVRLQGLRSQAEMVAEIVQACALPEPAARSVAALAQALSRRQICLVLDNCEHLLAEVSPLLSELLAQAPGLRVLATSQGTLGHPEERRLWLQPLALPPADGTQLEQHAAGALMLRRLHAAGRPLQIDGAQATMLAGICRALDGVPLQIELAASRILVLGLEGVQAHLQDRLELLRQHGQGMDARHRSLRSAITWSHELLDPAQRRVWHRLSVFESGFGTAAARQLLADTDALAPWEALDSLELLANHSLIAPAEDAAQGPAAGADGVPHEPRWRLLQSLRLFAAEQLALAGEAGRTRDAHARLMLAQLRQHMRDAHDLPIRDWAARVRPQLPDLRAALEHAAARDPERAWALWALLVVVWLRSGLQHEATDSWQRLRATLPPAADPPVRADCALAVGLMCLYNLPVELAQGSAAADEAWRLNAELGRPLPQYHALYVRGQLQLRQKQSVAGQGTLAAMAALEQPGWPPMRRRYLRLLQGYSLAQQGQSDAFRRSASDELALALEMGNRDYIWTCRHSLGQALFACGDIAGATTLFEQTWAEIEQARQPHLYWSTQALTAVLLAARDAQGARSAMVRGAVQALWRHQQLALACPVLPWRCAWQGQWADAARLLGWVQALLRGRGERPGPIPAWALQTLQQRLQGELQADALQALVAEGECLSEAQALALGLPERAGAGAALR